ncbi:MAG: SH3 domain-containing protein [Peptococcia bacterium]
MKRVRPGRMLRLRLLVFVLGFMLLALPVLALDEGVVKGNNVNVRKGPGTNYAAITQVKAGQALYILSTQNNWFQVRLSSGTEGWIRNDLVNRVLKKVRVKGSTVNIRTGPGTNHKVAGKVYTGQVLSVLAEKNGWYKVHIGGIAEAWIAGWYTVDDPSGGSSNAGNAGNTGSNGNVGNAGSGSVTGGTVKITANVLNVRQGPGTNYPLVTKIGLNEQHNVLAQQNGWYKIKVNNQEGWVSGDYVQYTPPANPPAATSPGTPDNSGTSGTSAPDGSAPADAASGSGQTPTAVQITGNYVNIQERADLNAPVVEQANSGDAFVVLDSKNGWYQVRLTNDKIGWVSSEYAQPYSGTLPSRSVQKKEVLIVPIADGKTFKIIDNGGRPELKLEGWTDKQYRFRKTKEEVKMILELDGYSTRKYEGKVERVGITQLKVYPERSKAIVEMDFNFVPAPGIGKTDSNKVTVIPVGMAGTQSRSLVGKTIVLDPGHASVQPGGWPDPGALGSKTKIHEKDVNLAITLKLKTMLEQGGAKVILTHSGQTTLSLAGRAAIANNLNADIFVSIHANYNNKPAIAGHTTYYYAPASKPELYAQRQQREKLASAVQREMVKSCGRKDNGILQANFAVLRETKVPSILVETAYLSNPDEEQLLCQDWFRQKLAEGIFNGIKSYFSN